ncbi:outer membrane beta-barrel protein [Mesonia sp. MT50]|uniref:Outer membrane beta-barrel protein n=1 Tax=Mesonia profundi TaxID=3070998 RepID=A0ABU1A1I1_9FLAO|nr:outer membrane beta-barrel protein [Mesonia profundi]MDQ7917550.1 outer membrane beta-barrel protein [Mesonia profundi]
MAFKNMLTQFFLLGFLLIFASAEAQEYKIQGKVIDSENVALESATIYVETVKDSSLVDYTITDVDGSFVIEGSTDATEVNLYISFTGFQTYKKKYQLSENSMINTGSITLNLADNTLGEVVVQATKAPVSIKTDTLEFNASSFKTKADANLEEVLKKLPGVTVDKDGAVSVNGKKVSRVLVNGKEFFGDDPKIATKNLPKEIINKIQVVDTKTKSEEFTGKEGDSENKTINITIDEDKNKGYFARLTAGGGTDERYELSGIGNYFKDDLRVSILASSNNINSSGFTFDEVFDAMGRSAYSIARSSNGSFSINGNSFGGGGGVTKSDNGGISLVNEWDDETELSANYFFNRGDTKTRTQIERENILPDRTYFNNSISSSDRKNDNHRARFGFEFQPDTLTRISFRPNMTVNKGFSKSNSNTSSFGEDGNPINNAETEQFSNLSSTNFSNRLNVTRKFGSKGGFISLGFDNTNNTSEEENVYFSSREIYDDLGNLEDTDIQDQFINQNTRKDEYSVRANTRLPLSEKLSLDVSYSYTKSKGKSERLIYEKDDVTGEYDVLVDTLSNDFNSETFNHRPNIGLVYKDDKLRASISGGLENVRLKNEDLFSETSFDNTYNNLYSNAYFRYKINKTKSIYFNYRNSRDTPSITQLQPVTNTTNPLNVVTGNPNLDPSLEHRMYMNFNNYDFKSRSGFYAYLGGNLTNDKVVAITTTNEDLVRTTTYTNVDGVYSMFVGASLDKTITLESKNTIKIDAGVNGNFSKDLGFSNGVKFDSNRYIVSPRVGVQYDIIDVLTVEPSYDISFNNAKYSLNNTRDQNYINHDIALEVTSYWPKNFVFGNDISYRHLGNIAPGFKNDFVLWNMSLGYKVMGDDGIFKVKVFDVLDQNISTSRNTGDDFVQDTQELVLEQYVMFSFTYKLSKFGGKDPNKKGGRF